MGFVLGLSPEELEYLATARTVLKTSRRDFPYILANKVIPVILMIVLIFINLTGDFKTWILFDNKDKNYKWLFAYLDQIKLRTCSEYSIAYIAW